MPKTIVLEGVEYELVPVKGEVAPPEIGDIIHGCFMVYRVTEYNDYYDLNVLVLEDRTQRYDIKITKEYRQKSYNTRTIAKNMNPNYLDPPK